MSKLAHSNDETMEQIERAARDRPSVNDEPVSVRLMRLDDPLYAVCVGGRWDGWLMRAHPDGQWVSVRKLHVETLNG